MFEIILLCWFSVTGKEFIGLRSEQEGATQAKGIRGIRKMTIRPNEKSGMCGICSAGCGVVVTYDQKGRITAVRHDSDSPFGMICRVGEHSPEIIYSKDRILYPMRRNGPKGGFDFKRISW